MKTKKSTEKQLSNLRLAYEAKQIAQPYLDKGENSLARIYLNHVVEEIPVCINTFLEMMKKDVSVFPQLAKAYKEKVRTQYAERLKKQKEKRKNLLA